MFLITGITGTSDGRPITGLLPINAPLANPFGDGFVHNDNLLTFAPGSSTGETDSGGIAFSLANGEDGIISDNIIFFADADSISEPEVPVFINDRTNPVPNPFVPPPNPNPTPTPTPTPSPVPEPSSICLLGTGVLGAAGMVRRRLAR